jgi:hypothetical protein
MRAYMIKAPGNMWRPADDASGEAMNKFPLGQVCSFEAKRTRNYRFLKKFMAMLDHGFDAWEPPTTEYKGMPVQKERESFREYCIIAAGFKTLVVDLNGGVHAKAKSISFANMEEEEFERVYSAVADVLLQWVLKTYKRADLDRVVNEMLAFT